MHKVVGLFLILLPLCSASESFLRFNKLKLPLSQADGDPNCPNVPAFRQCYSDFLKQFGINDITQPFDGDLTNALNNDSQAELQFLHNTFNTFTYCLNKQQLQSCVNMATFQGFGINQHSANLVVWDFMVGTYLYLTAYQTYYVNFQCFDARLKQGLIYTDSPQAAACNKAASNFIRHRDCPTHDDYLNACVPFWNMQCNDQGVGAMFCNVAYMSDAWDNSGWTQFSHCNNVCPVAGQPNTTPAVTWPTGGPIVNGAVKSEAYHTVFILASLLLLSRLFFK